MKSSKKIIVLSLIIAIFVLIVSLSSWYVQMEITIGNVCSCAIPLPVIIPIIASIGLLLGTLVYYIYSPRSNQVTPEFILRFFNGDERDVMKVLFENKGAVSQAKIVGGSGLSKVRVFRVLERLKSKGIVKKESMGKTNLIELPEDVKKVLFAKA